ncbi:MAG: glycosyltransferase [Clostridia bacterium]|nr:glycosyltransferase [Clostridia bacterium]
MKKILIVNNNLDIGGIQKSLVNLLRQLGGEGEITLLLFSPSGALLDKVPEQVKIITPQNCYRILGLSRNELKKYPLLYMLKGFLVKYAAVFSRRGAMKLLGLLQKPLCGYDMAISYSHLPHHKSFANGCGDFVLDKVQAAKKVCFVHCDYSRAGSNSAQNSAQYREFDKIACCSEGVAQVFVKAARAEKSRVCTVRNFFDLTVTEQACKAPCTMDERYINILTVARLSPEKGIADALCAFKDAGRQDIRYTIIGDGPEKSRLMAQAAPLGDRVIFAGESSNPYGYMAAADYLLVPSLHEAAPMVFDEARALALPVISTDTLSARELLSDGDIIYTHPKQLQGILHGLHKSVKRPRTVQDNNMQTEQFKAL